MSKPGQAVNVRLSPQDMATLRKIAQPRERVSGKRVKESISGVIRRLIRDAGEARQLHRGGGKTLQPTSVRGNLPHER